MKERNIHEIERKHLDRIKAHANNTERLMWDIFKDSLSDAFELGFFVGQGKKNNHLRHPVQLFAERMEKKLKRNDHKGGWHDMNIGQLLDRQKEETKEAKTALNVFWAHICANEPKEATREALEAALDELADMGNFTMMLSDRIKRIYKDAHGDDSQP